MPGKVAHPDWNLNDVLITFIEPEWDFCFPKEGAPEGYICCSANYQGKGVYGCCGANPKHNGGRPACIDETSSELCSSEGCMMGSWACGPSKEEGEEPGCCNYPMDEESEKIGKVSG